MGSDLRAAPEENWYQVHDDVYRSIKVQTLRDAAAEFRRIAATETDPQLNILAACMLEQRAERIADGEDDHSDLPVDISAMPQEPAAEQPQPPEEQPESRLA